MRAAARAAALLCAVALVSVSAPAANASPYIHAHRGGPLVEGVPTFGEETMAAYRSAAADGFVLEADVKLTSDGVPVVIHDATLDRTTDCSGQVSARTLAELAPCRVDILGTDSNTVQLGPSDPRRAPIPTLAELLAFARDSGAQLNLEIKNIPLIEPDFDPTDGFANSVVDVIEASGFPPSRLIVQSFWPPNLNVVEARIPRADTLLLTSNEIQGAPIQTNEAGPAFADANGYEWVGPQWPFSAQVVPQAHGLGLQVAPYTLDSEERLTAAFHGAVDAVFTNDPNRARRVFRGLEGDPPAPPPPPSPAECEAAEANRREPPIEAYEPRPGAPRVFAIQFKQELRHVVSYESFRTKVECLIRDYVVPSKAAGRPNVVALNEDIGLMTIATGTRGEPARAIFGNPDVPGCEGQPAPCGALGALGAVTTAYAPQVAAYQARFAGDMQPVSSAFVAATDTFGRGWMQLFSDLAKRYGVYILGSNNQSPFRESRDPTEIALFADPDLPEPETVFVATEPAVYNEVFMWGPEDVRQEGPLPLRNVVAQNKKVPLTPIEEQLQLTNGPSTGPDAIENLRPYRIPGTGARVGFATSKPAFEYDGPNSQFSLNQELAPGIDPCSDTYAYYMRCLDRLGANLVMQDEANGGGRWTGQSGEGNYTPLEWMRSTWRTAGDTSVSFAYNVTPFMVGNLADLGFDGQTSITQRGLDGGRSCTYVGNRFQPGAPENDPAYLAPYAGPKPEFLAIVPWVVPDGPRDGLREAGARLAAGSGDPEENDYIETAIAADLPFPPQRFRANCVRAGEDSTACRGAIKGTAGDDRLRGTPRAERIFGLAGDDRLRGFGRPDCLFGQRGDDRLAGGLGRDTVRGGRGRDRIFARDRTPDLIRCGRGRDRVTLDAADRVRGCERVIRKRR